MVVPSGMLTSTVAASMERLSQRATVVPSALVTWTRGGDPVTLAVASGALVSVGAEDVGVKAAAVRVNWAMTVPAADVRMAATSGVDSAWGVFEDPHPVITRVAISIMLRVSFSFIEPLYPCRKFPITFSLRSRR